MIIITWRKTRNQKDWFWRGCVYGIGRYHVFRKPNGEFRLYGTFEDSGSLSNLAEAKRRARRHAIVILGPSGIYGV